MSLRGKKRSVPGTILYCVAILLKLLGIAISYLLISENDYFLWFIGGDGMGVDLEEQGIGTLYFGSMAMALQVGILLYSLTHDNYQLGGRDQRPWMKSLIFLWTPVHALFVWFRDYGRSIMSWEYAAMVIVDLMIFVGLLSKTGRSWANRLRPFKDHHKKHHSGGDGGSDGDGDGGDDGDGGEDKARGRVHGDVEEGRCLQLPTCPVHGSGDRRNGPDDGHEYKAPRQQGARQEDDPSYNYSYTHRSQQTPPGNPKIRVDGLSE